MLLNNAENSTETIENTENTGVIENAETTETTGITETTETTGETENTEITDMFRDSGFQVIGKDNSTVIVDGFQVTGFIAVKNACRERQFAQRGEPPHATGSVTHNVSTCTAFTRYSL